MSFPLHCTGASDAAGLFFFLGGKSRLWGMQVIMGFACMCLPPAQLRSAQERVCCLHGAKLSLV